SALIDRVVVEADPKREQIVIVGQSYSYLGLDGAQVQTLIDRNGHEFQIIQLTVEGVYNIEQDAVLEAYLVHAPHPPKAIFFEIGIESRYWPAVSRDQLWRPLTIAASNLPHTLRRIVGSWERNRDEARQGDGSVSLALLPTAARSLLTDIGTSIGHFLCRATNCGVLQQLDPQ